MTAFMIPDPRPELNTGPNRAQRRKLKKYERYIGTPRELRIHRGFTKSTKPKK